MHPCTHFIKVLHSCLKAYKSGIGPCMQIENVLAAIKIAELMYTSAIKS